MERIPVIEASRLSIGYAQRNGRKKVVHNSLDLRLYAGEVTCLLGLNGAGKSTLLRTLGGFQPALGGEVLLFGKPLSAYSPSALSLITGVVLTEKTNAGGITVCELVSLGRHPHTGFFGRLKKHDRETVEQSLEAAGISHKATAYVAELSDGERQKAMIAKALAQQCPIILLDEPTAFLDVASRIETMSLLRKLAKEQQKTILLSTHDMDLAIQMADRLWLLEKERPLTCGAPEDLILDGRFQAFFCKDGLTFDSSVGKLNTVTPFNPVGLTGDSLTSYWAGNALARNGWSPAPPDDRYMNVHCINRQHITITPPGSPPVSADSIDNLISVIKNTGQRK
jgi:iron complex transport system ATP-binding protein